MRESRKSTRMAIAATVLSLLAAGMVVAGTAAFKVYFASNFKDRGYQEATATKVAAAWKRPAVTPEPGHKAVVIVDIQRDGRGASPRLHLKSGSEAWDAAALEAVRKASPFGPLPASYKGTSVEVHFHWEYNK